jgi:hypothetical protein
LHVFISFDIKIEVDLIQLMPIFAESHELREQAHSVAILLILDETSNHGLELLLSEVGEPILLNQDFIQTLTDPHQALVLSVVHQRQLPGNLLALTVSHRNVFTKLLQRESLSDTAILISL